MPGAPFLIPAASVAIAAGLATRLEEVVAAHRDRTGVLADGEELGEEALGKTSSSERRLKCVNLA